ncbi:MAG TPA: class I SAM-dependent methyltransferase [Burkholderiales bacterium]|nr:class I SAM-dependent methyltransferase [Burkholderiales bacterium]
MAKHTAEQAYKIACYHYQTARYDTAEVLCRQILHSVPGHRDALMLLAILAQRSGRKTEGDECLRQAVESKDFSITLDTRLDSRPRWSPHAGISAILEAAVERYRETLQAFEHYLPWLDKIAFDSNPQEPGAPHWNNVWMPVLDAVALYCLVALKRPRRYIEIGSGNSTKFVARAIADHNLQTRIISIDPQPRAEVDPLCSEIVRKPLEQCNLETFSALGTDDIVFVDSSHRSYMNSDVTVFFCEILPQLASGVIVGVHDVFLPHDYPEDWIGRYYSEQYLLACYLLAGTQRFEISLPVFYAASQGLGGSLLQQVRSKKKDASWQNGTSFWMRMR